MKNIKWEEELFLPLNVKGFLMRYCNNEKGFSFPEVIVVIVILGIAMAMATAVINYGFLSGLKTYTVSHQIAADMRYAQRMAITDNKEYDVSFTASSPYQNYKIYKSTTPSVIVKTVDIPAGISCTGDDLFTFLSDGSANSGSIYVSDSKVTRYITVNGSSGRVKVSE